MKISVNWLQYLCDHYGIDVKIMPEGGIDQLVEIIGTKLGAVEEVNNVGEKYQGIIIAKVVSCSKHPDADKLSVCLIDDGGAVKDVKRDDQKLVQVVCGAPNVREGMLVAWLPPGTTLPASFEKEPLVLESRDIRGVISNGMLASAAELGISDDHSGILEIEREATIIKKDPTIDQNDHVAAIHNYESLPKYHPGDNFSEVFQLNDYIIDIENKMFTHRPDCFGMLGVAREIAGITGQNFVSPKVYLNPRTIVNDDNGLQVAITNELPELVPRFMAQVFENIEVRQSPIWLQTYLSRVGLRPINTIVDITNYFMLQTGQPMHAYDYDKVKALSGGEAAIMIRYPNPGEKIKLLNGKEIEPRPEAIMIATDKQLIGLGGVMGGSETEVDENTKNIILECANFDMYSIRRTSMEHGLFTDAVTRFSKGQSPLQCDRVMAWAQDDIICYAAGSPGNVYDVKGALKTPPEISINREFINSRLGLDLSVEEMSDLLTNVEFAVFAKSDELLITAPFWRTDIEIKEDIVEEVGRLYGFGKLPMELPKRSIKPTKRDELFDLKTKIRERLSQAGANEVLTYSFVHGDLLAKAGQDPKDAFQLSNALSPDLQYYRISLIPSLLDKVHPNLKAGIDEFAIFEINKGQNKVHAAAAKDVVPDEVQILSLVYAAADKAAHPAGAAYYQAQKYLTALFGAFGIRPVYAPLEKDPGYPITQPFDHTRSALVTDSISGTFIGMVGEFRGSVRRNLKLPVYSAGFELTLEGLMEATSGQKYVTMPKFPSVQQDISLKVASDLNYQELVDFVWSELAKIQPAKTLPTLSPVDIYGRPDDPSHKQITLRLKIAAFDRTLKAEEVNNSLDQVAAAAHEKFGAERL